MDFLKDLNEVQRQAVEQCDGPSLIIAGAGSGKTRVLTYRVAYLLQRGVAPSRILALTFTNKAAREMRERIAALVGEDTARYLWMGTFHSIFSRILRRESESLQYPSTFTIYDAQDARNLVKQIVKEMGLNDKTYNPKQIASRISSAKNNLLTAAAYAANSDVQRTDQQHGCPRIAEVYEKYVARCRKSAVMDFDDLLLNTNILFRDFPAVLDRYQQRFSYILVDEYQDTNYAQYLIVKKLAQQHGNVCVVGDDSQSIYAFRGAQIANILNFRNDYPDYRMFKLEQNYRSTKVIVSAANSLIAKNVNRIPKEVWSANDEGERIKVFHASNDFEEGFMVVRSMQDLLYGERIPYREMAILYRTHAQSRIFEEKLRNDNIPYVVYGGLSFYQRKEVKDVLAYLRLIVNPHDDEAFRRVINTPSRGIGETTLQHIAGAAEVHGTSLWAAAEHLAEWVPSVNAGTQRKVTAFMDMMRELAVDAETKSAYEVAEKTVRMSGLLTALREEQVPENISRIENIEELLNGAMTFVADNANEERQVLLSDYLENVALLTDMDQATEDDDHVTLMTIHSAKGLEFDAVYVVGLEEELFPSSLSMTSLQELEEERRLFYVAMTRARKRLFLSYADTRRRNGTSVYAPASRFLREIDAQYLDMPDRRAGRFGEQPGLARPAAGGGFRGAGRPVEYGQKSYYRESGAPGMSAARPSAPRPSVPHPSVPADAEPFVPDAPERIQQGMTVLHRSFGRGEVLAIEGVEPNSKATVRFESSGMKQLLLKFARLKIVE